jgi:hypothetical protein
MPCLPSPGIPIFMWKKNLPFPIMGCLWHCFTHSAFWSFWFRACVPSCPSHALALSRGKRRWRSWRTVSLWKYSNPPTKLVKYYEILLTYWWNIGERCMFYLFGGHFLTKTIAPTHPGWHLDRLAWWVSWMSPPYGLPPTEISKAKRPRADCFGGNAWAAVFPAQVSAKRQLLKP